MKLTKILSAVMTAALLTVFAFGQALAQGEDCSKLREGTALRKNCEARNAALTPGAPAVQPTPKPGATKAAAQKIETSFTGEAGSDWVRIDVRLPEDCVGETCKLGSVKFTEGEPGFLSSWVDYPAPNSEIQKIEGGVRITIRNVGLKADTTYTYEVSVKIQGKDVKAQAKFRTGSAGFQFGLPNFGNVKLPGFDLVACLIVLVVLGLLGFGIYLVVVYRRSLTSEPPPPPPDAPL